MKGLVTKIGLATATAILLAVVFVPPADTAGGSFLYWAAPQVKTSSINTCYAFASDAMRHQNFQNIRRSGSEVTGSSGSTYAAITCIGTTPRATAVVMVVGSNGQETSQVRDNLRKKIAGIVQID